MKNILRILIILFFIIMAGYIYSSAQEDYYEEEVATLYKGEIKVIAVDNVTRVAVSNPDVADVVSAKKNEILVVAKDAGTTNLIWWDNLGEHALALEVFAKNMSIVEKRIDELLKDMDLLDVFTRSSDSQGKVLILGRVKTSEDVERIDKALRPLQKDVINLVKVEEEEASIEIEVQVLELKKGATEQLGFTSTPTGTTLTEPSGKYGTKLTGIPEALFHLTDWSRQTFQAQLKFLVQEGQARVLSRPRLVCQSGMEAELLVGGEKPVLTTSVSEGGAATEVEYKEYGIKLRMNPKVLPGNRIQVFLNVDVTEVEATAETLGSANQPTALAYPILKRSTSTQLVLANGQTLAISGLIKRKKEDQFNKVPWLGDIPILGMFFRGRTTYKGGGAGELGESELVVTLTPTILLETKALTEEAMVLSRSDMIERIIQTQEISPGVEEEISPGIEEERPGIANYTSMVIKRIRDNFVYPSEAYENKLEGVVRLSLHLASDGQLLEVNINRSSGWTILDNNAVRTIRRISPFPSFPPDIREKELWINIPIAYNLQ